MSQAFSNVFGGMAPEADTPSGGPGYTDNSRQEGVGAKPLSELKKMFDDFRATTATNRLQRLVDYDYYDGNQLTPQEVAKLRNRGQPDIVVNRTRVAINGTLGVIARSPTDPRAWGRNGEDEAAASVATDCLRYAMETARFNRIKVECAKDNLVGGTCAAIVGVDRSKRITVAQIRWEEFFYDPRSRKVDFSDAKYMGIAKWMFVDDVGRLYPEGRDELESTMEGGSATLGATDETFQDRPLNQGWLDLRQKRAMVVEIYYREGADWFKGVFYYGGILEQGPSPFVGDDKQPCNPIIAVSCYVDRDNNRYGMVKDMRDLQDEINKRRQKLLHIVNNSQIQARDPSAIEVDADTAREEAARPDGVIPYGWEKVPTTDMAAGQQMLLTEAKNEMERFGPNPAILGRQGADSSGRALLARQQAGLVELAVVLDQLQEWELQVYRSAWSRIQQYWTDPMTIRVTDDTMSPKYVKLNQPPPPPPVQPQQAPPGGPPQAGNMNGMMPPQMQAQVGQQPQSGPPGTPMDEQPQGGGNQSGNPQPAPDPSQIAAIAEQAAVDPITLVPIVPPQTLGYQNNVAEMDVDIIIDTTPATATILQEQFKDLMDLVSANPLYAQEVPFTLFLELMPGVPRKRQLIQKIEAYKQQVQQTQQQQQAKQEASQDAMLQAKVQDMTSKSVLNQALANKAAGDAHATAVRADTGANKALYEATIAHEETNIHKYEALQAANTKAAEADASPSKDSA